MSAVQLVKLHYCVSLASMPMLLQSLVRRSLFLTRGRTEASTWCACDQRKNPCDVDWLGENMVERSAYIR